MPLNVRSAFGLCPRLRSRCGAVRIFGHVFNFRCRRKGILVLWWLEVDFSRQVQD